MFIKNYDKKSEQGYFLGVDVQYPKILYERYCDLPFLPERKKLGKKEKLVTNLHDKNEYVVHIRNLKQALNHGLILKRVHGVNLSQLKEEETIWCQNQIILQQNFSQKIYIK